MKRRCGRFGRELEVRELLADMEGGRIDNLTDQYRESFRDLVDEAVLGFEKIFAQKEVVLGDLERERKFQRRAKATEILCGLDISTLIAEFIVDPRYPSREGSCTLYIFSIAIRADPAVWPCITRYVSGVLRMHAYEDSLAFRKISRGILGELCRLQYSNQISAWEVRRLGIPRWYDHWCHLEEVIRAGILNLGTSWFTRVYLPAPIRDQASSVWWKDCLRGYYYKKWEFGGRGNSVEELYLDNTFN